MSSLRDQLNRAGFAASEPSTPAPEATEEAAPTLRFAPKVVVRFSKKGRGGKAVTLVTGVQAGHDEVVATLKRELGTGGRRDGDAIVIQGNQVERVAAWFERHGARKVVRS